MKVLGLISSPIDPASRARIMQYVPWMKNKGVSLYYKYYTPLKDADPNLLAGAFKKVTGLSEWRASDAVKSIGRLPLLFQQLGYDIIWQNRLLMYQHDYWEKKLTKPVIFDFDDAIWMNEGARQVNDKIARSTMIFAGNEFLANYARRYNKEVHIVPSTVDTEILFPSGNEQEQFTIGWIGTKSNFNYLEKIKDPILQFLAEDNDVRFLIISSEMPAFFQSDNRQIFFKKWESGKENEYINECSVGIMPLGDFEWSRGKCGYKLLQYLACGKPIIASPIGVNEIILNDRAVGLAATNSHEWVNAFQELKKDHALCQSFGNNGRNLVIEKYSCEAWVDTIIDHMKSIT